MQKLSPFALCVASLVALGIFPFTVHAAPEARCSELGDNCVCSEPLNTSDFALKAHGNNFVVNPADSESKQCREKSNGASWYRLSDLEIVQDTAKLPPGHEVEYVWRNISPSGVSNITGNSVEQGSTTKRVCTRLYVNFSQDYTGHGDSGTHVKPDGRVSSNCVSNKLAEFSMKGYVQLKEGGNKFSTGFSPRWTEKERSAAHCEFPDGTRMGHKDCKDQWCIVEHCLSGDLGAKDNDIHYEGYIRGVTDGRECTMARTRLGQSPNEGGVGRMWIANMFRTSGQYAPPGQWCKGYRQFSHAMQAEWDYDEPGLFIGPALEIEPNADRPDPVPTRGLPRLRVLDVSAPNTLVVEVTFSAPVDENTASDPDNYAVSLNGTELVISAAVRPALDKVVLWVERLAPGVTYTLSVRGVRDLSTPETLVQQEDMSFTVAGEFGCQVSFGTTPTPALPWLLTLVLVVATIRRRRAFNVPAIHVASVMALGICLTSTPASALDVGKWHRHVITLPNATYSGNPFELEVDGVFTHESGITVRLPGYYAGNDEWKIGFMPIELGEWTYVTVSNDPDLNGVRGSLDCVPSGLPGTLAADPEHPKKWKFADGDYAVPIALRMPIFSEPATRSQFERAADFFEANNLHMMETRLLEEYGQFDGRTDFIFKGDWRDHEFDLDIWDRMEERMEILTERGLGAHVMFYSDDAGKPRWGGRSDTEGLVIRYAVARLVGYPVVWYNTGIDIGEYRNCPEIDWFGEQLGRLDPYDHPYSSRQNERVVCEMKTQTFSSEFLPLQAYVDDMIQHFKDHNIPVSMDDAWGENRGNPRWAYKDHSADDIRRAFWKTTIAGGIGGLIRGGGDGGSRNGMYFINHVQSDLESEQWLKLINPYVNSRFGEVFGEMVPNTSVVRNGYAIANPSKSHMLFLLIGNQDKYDATNGGPVTVRLNGLSGAYTATWFDPRTGRESDAGTLPGGEETTLTPPSKDDWVLSVVRDGPRTRDLSPLRVIDVHAPNTLVVELTFSSPVDEATASNPENYTVSLNGTALAIREAIRPTPDKVVLWVKGLAPGVTYDLSVRGVRDLSTRETVVREEDFTFTVVGDFGCQVSFGSTSAPQPAWVVALVLLFGRMRRRRL